MRRITKIVIHCSATPEGRSLRAADIDRMHRERGWAGIGYHYVIGIDGKTELGRPVSRIGSHVAGHNRDSIGVVYIGGLAKDGRTPKDTRTPAQKNAMRLLIAELRSRFPDADLFGHRDLSPDKDGDGKVEKHEWLKACPCFDVATEL